MRNIQKLIEISQLDIEDKNERLLVELAILENKNFKVIKEMSMEALQRLINKYHYMYTTETVTPKNTFIIEGQTYSLPITLYGLPYGIWEDIEAVNNNKTFGETFWEKFPYLLYILTYGKNYVQDDASNNIMTESDKFKDISLEDALAVSSFFLLWKKPLKEGLQTYIELMTKQMIKSMPTLTKTKLLTKIQNAIIKFGGLMR